MVQAAADACVCAEHGALDQIKIHFANTHARKQTTIYSKANIYTLDSNLKTVKDCVNI